MEEMEEMEEMAEMSEMSEMAEMAEMAEHLHACPCTLALLILSMHLFMRKNAPI